jgi:hypothetical protein
MKWQYHKRYSGSGPCFCLPEDEPRAIKMAKGLEEERLITYVYPLLLGYYNTLQNYLNLTIKKRGEQQL